MKRIITVGLFIVLYSAQGPAFSIIAATEEKGDPLFKDFKRVVPRGRIESVDHPQFVSAQEARIADEAWVLGVVIENEARAYSLNLLNHNEVVNDQIKGRPVAAVW